MNQEKTINLTQSQLNAMLEGNSKAIHEYYLSVITEKERALAEVSLGMKRITDMYNAAVEHIHKMEAEQKEDEPVGTPDPNLVESMPSPVGVETKKEKRKG